MCTRTLKLVAAACSSLLLSTSLPLAAHQVTRPSTQGTVSTEKLHAKVAEIIGKVQVRDTEDSPWRTPKVGELLPVGGECRTGPRSAIKLTMPPDQVITLDRMGTV